MSRLLWLAVSLCLSGCITPPVTGDKVFSNARIQYEARQEKKDLKKKRAMEMPSYFLELEYESGQTTLNKAQVKKVDVMIGKIIYPEEYKLYISFGPGDDETQVKNLAPVFARAQDIKRHVSSKIKNIKIAYLKNQKPNCVYLRLIT